MLTWRAAIAGALLLAGCTAEAANQCLAPAPARERKPVGAIAPYSEPTKRVMVEFRPAAQIAARQAQEPYREDYEAKALAFYVSPTLGMLWFPDDGSVSVDLILHEICHLQEDPKRPGFLKDHDDFGRWHHTGRKDVC